MNPDEQQIRELVETWKRATLAGDTKTVLGLMTEDVIFLLPGRPPMRGREGFAAASKAMENRFKIESSGEIKELHIGGDMAYAWSELSVKITDTESGTVKRRSGDVLTVFRKQPDSRWLLSRDANMLTADAPPKPD